MLEVVVALVGVLGDDEEQLLDEVRDGGVQPVDPLGPGPRHAPGVGADEEEVDGDAGGREHEAEARLEGDLVQGVADQHQQQEEEHDGHDQRQAEGTRQLGPA